MPPAGDHFLRLPAAFGLAREWLSARGVQRKGVIESADGQVWTLTWQRLLFCSAFGFVEVSR